MPLERIADMPGIGHRREDLTPYPVLFGGRVSHHLPRGSAPACRDCRRHARGTRHSVISEATAALKPGRPAIIDGPQTAEPETTGACF